MIESKILDNTAEEIKELESEGGDIYQKYAERHGITRYAAKLRLFSILYGKEVKQ